jgi:hypothetical protein
MDASFTKEIPLSDAAFELRQPWRTCYDWLLTGKLEGRRKAGRWVVDVASVERVRAETEGTSPISA